MTASDNADNTVVVNDATSRYEFAADAFLQLLRDEGVRGANMGVVLMEGQSGNRSAATRRRIVVDCHKVVIRGTRSRPAPGANRLEGAAFCNFVALHEVYHLLSMYRYRSGGREADADAFAARQLAKYTLVVTQQ